MDFTDTNGLGGELVEAENRLESVSWKHPGLKVTRLLLKVSLERPEFNIAFCHGEVNGRKVQVSLPVEQLPILNTSKYLYELSQKEGARPVGLFNAIVVK